MSAYNVAFLRTTASGRDLPILLPKSGHGFREQTGYRACLHRNKSHQNLSSSGNASLPPCTCTRPNSAQRCPARTARCGRVIPRRPRRRRRNPEDDTIRPDRAGPRSACGRESVRNDRGRCGSATSPCPNPTCRGPIRAQAGPCAPPRYPPTCSEGALKLPIL